MNLAAPLSAMAGLITLAVALAAALYLCWLMLQPFLNVLLWASVLAVVFYPMHRRIRTRLGHARHDDLLDSRAAVTAALGRRDVLPVDDPDGRIVSRVGARGC